MRLKRTAAVACLTLVALLCLVYFGLWAVVQTRPFHSWLEAQARPAGADLTLGPIFLSFPFNLVVSSVNAASPDGFKFRCKQIRADLNPLALAFGQINDLTFVEPWIHLRITPSAQHAEAPPIKLIVRSLTIADARVEIDTGGDRTITIPRINLTGHDVNLGDRSGNMQTTAFLPELNTDLKIRLTASASGMKADLEMIQERSSKKPVDAEGPPSVQGRGEVALHFEPNAAIRLTGQMSFDRFAVHSMTYTGKLELLAETDANHETIAVDLRSDTTHLTGSPWHDLNQVLPVSAKVTGDYATRNKELTLSAIHATSSVATVQGKARLSLDEEPRLTAAVFEIPQVGLAQLYALLPPPYRAPSGDIKGKLSAKLTVAGKLEPWSLAGVLETTGTRTSARGTDIQQIQANVPFAFRSGHLEATGLRLVAQKLAWRPPGQQIDAGATALEIKGDFEDISGKNPSFDGGIDIEGGRFATDDGLTAAESIQGTAAIQLELPVGGLILNRLKVQLKSMEFLWHRFFADFKPEKPELNMAATYDSRAGTLRIDHARLALERIGTIDLHGQLIRSDGTPTFNLRIRAPEVRLANFYDFFIRETFKTTQPLIDELKIDGIARADVTCRGVPAKFLVEGTAQLQGSAIGRPDHWRVGPIDLTLPFKIEYPKRPALVPVTRVPRAGLAVRSIKFGNSEVPPFTVFLSLWDNTLTVRKAFAIPVYGGALTVERLGWQDIIGSPKNFTFSGRADDISLAPLSRDLGWYQFDGSLSGVIPQVSWIGNTLRTNGDLDVHVFDGQIKIEDLEVTSLTGSWPRIKVNVDIRDVNLERVTKAFEFGTISGIVAGKIEGLVISNGQPSQFRADVQTVPKPGVSQWISVKALNKIVVLGSGTEGGASYGALTRFFDFYRYRKIGFKAQLRNDVLILHGIKSQDGKDFLVEGTLIPPTVNVVSHMQRISFTDLVRRLERIKNVGGPGEKAVP